MEGTRNVRIQFIIFYMFDRLPDKLNSVVTFPNKTNTWIQLTFNLNTSVTE